MAKLLYALGMTAAKHRLATIALWVLLIVLAGIGANTWAGKTVDSFSIPGQESSEALKLMKQRFGNEIEGATARVVVESKNSTMRNPGVVLDTHRILAEMRAIDGVASVTDPFDPKLPTVSPDLTTAFATITFKGEPIDITGAQKDKLRSIAKMSNNADLAVDVQGDALGTNKANIGGIGELIGVLVALFVLAFTYRALVVAGMNIATALVGVAVGVLGITIATGFADLQSTTPILATMLGLAVGIDYTLFIVTRFRQQLLAGDEVKHGVAIALGTAGSAVLTAGLTVVIALCGLAIAGIPFLTQMGLAAAGTVVIAVLCATTLVPAVLSLLGRRALPRKLRNAPTVTPTDEVQTSKFFIKWANVVVNHRIAVLLLCVVFLGVIAIPSASLKTSLITRPPDNSTEQRAQETLAKKFGSGFSGPIVVLLDGQGAAAHAPQVVQQLAQLPDVQVAVPSAATRNGNSALVTVIPKSDPASETTVTLLKNMRKQLKGENPRAYVTGQTAVSVDVGEKLKQTLPIYLLVVVGLALVLLILVFRSILVPLVGVLGFLLTVGASFGAMVAVFQWGWLRDVFKPESVGPLLSLSPIIIVGILFGLAMDYQVFMVSRIHEAFSHGAEPREAVSRGFKQAAAVVFAAATIMFAVFAGFIPEGDSTIKAISFSLAIGILFDALIVRMLAMPAAIALMGKAGWAFPRWLNWLPSLDVEGRALENKSAPVGQSAD